jgi:hypothetical protein
MGPWLPLATAPTTTLVRTSLFGLITRRRCLALLVSHRVPKGEAEENEVRPIVREIGCHARAVEVTGARLAVSA